MSSVTLKAEGLKKSYKGRAVVNGVSLEVSSGEAVGLLGPNGAGKTTSFYMIVGLIQAEQGRISLNGEDLTHRPMHVRARHGIGYLPQDASVFRKMTVEENILAILQAQSGLEREAQHERMEELLEELNITHIRSSRGMSLSGGERRRVEIARALAVTPKFILLDEPFAGVDPISVMEIQKLIQQLCNKDIGVLITDHNVRETLGICERAYIINSGAVLASGTADEIITNEQVRNVYLGNEFSM